MRVLLADAEERRAKRLDEALAGSGCSVSRASHGAEALEVALSQVPDVLVCALELPIIEGGRLAEILRANPHLRNLAVVFLAEDELDAPVSLDLRDRIVLAPWESASVLARIEEACAGTASADARPLPMPEAATPTQATVVPAAPEPSRAQGSGEAGAGPRPEPARRAEPAGIPRVSAEVSQLPLSDLLQVLQQNHRSGSVRFIPPSGTAGGVVRLIDGRVVEAWVELGDGGRVRGEKALFRLLDATAGRFDFVPTEPDEAEEPTQPHIQRPLNTLLFEAARQRDEWERHRALLPQTQARLRLRVPRKEIPTASHPLTAAVLDALEMYARVGDVVDRCAFPDYQVLRVLHELMLSGAACVELSADPELTDAAEECDWLDADAARRVRDWMSGRRAGLGSGVKLLVVPGSPGAYAALDRALRATPGYRPGSDRPSGPTPLGPMGRLPLGQGLGLWFVAAPPDPAYAPVWRVAADGILGTLVVLGTAVSEEHAGCAAFLQEIDDQVPDRPRVYLIAGKTDGALATPESGRDVFALEHPQVASASSEGTEERADATATPAGLREALKRLLP